MKPISIIIGFTPYHAYAASQILKQLDGCVYCVFTKTWPDIDKPYIRVGPPTSWLVPGKAILTFMHFAVVVHGLIARGYPFDVYMPHPGHILSNYLFFTSLPGKRTFVYEDGLLNYYDANANNPFISKAKLLLARLGGMRYRDYTGHLAGYDAGSYDGAFLSMPDKAVRKDRLGTLHRLNFATEVFTPSPKTILFLDQDVSSHMSVEARERSIAAMLDAYSLENYFYHYKPHHDHASRLSAAMQPLAPELRSLPAEMLIERLRPSHVISFFSSALINIKRCWPKVECVSLAAEHIPITRDGKPSSLRELFQEIGVVCLSGA